MRNSLFHELSTLDACKGIWESIPAADTLKVSLGGNPENSEFNDLIPIWCTAAVWIHRILDQYNLWLLI